MQDPQLAAMYQQYLSGGVPRQIAQLQLMPGPSFGGGGTPDAMGGAVEGFGLLGEGLLDYLDSKPKTPEEEAAAAATAGTGAATPTSFTPTPLAPVPRPLDAPSDITMTELPPYNPAPMAPPQGPQRPLDQVLGPDFAAKFAMIFGG